MTTARKIKANRANARASTGPKTTEGKARSARNAHRHGLTASVLQDPAYEAELGKLAQEIAGQGASRELRSLAYRIAAAQIDVMRVRCARHELISRRLRDPDYRYVPFAAAKREIRYLARLLRTSGPDAVVPEEFESVLTKPTGPKKFATILIDCAADLAAMDRYERRALSRRKFAVRQFDAERAQ